MFELLKDLLLVFIGVGIGIMIIAIVQTGGMTEKRTEEKNSERKK